LGNRGWAQEHSLDGKIAMQRRSNSRALSKARTAYTRIRILTATADEHAELLCDQAPTED